MNKESRQVTNRTQARQIAVQTLYQFIDSQKTLTKDEAVDYALEVGIYPEEGYSDVAEEYLYTLIVGVSQHQTELDERIKPYLTGWSLNNLARIDLIILRLALFEIFYVSDEEVPALVAVSEAIELTKFFSDDKSRKFVNGVLAKVIETLPKEHNEDQ